MHAVVLFWALSLRFSAPDTSLTQRASYVTLLAPLRFVPPKPEIERPWVAPLPIAHSPPRVFALPHRADLSPTPVAPVEIVLLDQPIAVPLPIEPPRTQSALPPPPLILGKLSAAGTVAPSSISGVTLHATSFSTTANSAPGPEPIRTTRTDGFAEASSSASMLHKTTAVPPPASAVEILSKPRPLYTEEARQLRIEGEVLLEVLFTASGNARVERLLRGLGHGLDEAAAASATQIQFRPALRAGQPIDQTAIVHITFQLAY